MPSTHAQCRSVVVLDCVQCIAEIVTKQPQKTASKSDFLKMDLHFTKLQNLCRLCGQQLKEGARNSQPKGTLSKLILNTLGIDIASDRDDTHPFHVCTSCRLKMTRAHNKGQKSKVPVDPGISLFSFKEHSEGCRICFVQWNLQDICSLSKEKGYFSWVKQDCCVAIITDDLGQRILKRIIFHSSKWETYILGKEVSFPVEFKQDNIALILEAVKGETICTGNFGFETVNAHYRSKGLKNASGKIVAEVQEDYFNGAEMVQGMTIRHSKCHMICGPVQSGQQLHLCSMCRAYRSMLSSTESRLQKIRSNVPSKFARNDTLSREELTQKVQALTKEKRTLTQRQNTLSKYMSELMEKEGVSFDRTEEDKLEALVLSPETTKSFDELFPVDSCRRLLWEQQKKALTVKDKRQMRWHPALIRWAVAIRSKSSAAYNFIRESGFMVLPHESTLYGYTHFTNPEAGISADLLMRLYQDANIDQMEEHQKVVSLMHDEMKIKSGLVYTRSTGKFVGFMDVGDIESEMALFEKRCAEQADAEEDDRLASHVLVFMVRGLTTSLRFPVAYFPTHNVTGGQLVPLVWKVIRALSVIGLTVKCIVSDGASSNRKLYNIIGQDVTSNKGPKFFAKNIYKRSPHSKIYFLCDTPHLIKTTRNNVENSQWNKKTKNLMYNGQYISWPQLVRLYEKDQGLGRITPGLRLLPKLRHEHFYLTPSLRMKVNLAAQVLSRSVANALERSNEPGTSSTVEFLRKIDKFFDCLNVSSFMGWQKKRNENLKPYTSQDDIRFKWLKEDFLGYLQKWEDEGNQTSGMSASQRQKLCLSWATLDGMRITVNSFVAVAKEILQMEGVKYLLSDKLNQDPVEEFFSKQRGAGGHHDNPSLDQFGHHLLENVVAASASRGSVRANVRLADPTGRLDDTPLPKRKR